MAYKRKASRNVGRPRKKRFVSRAAPRRTRLTPMDLRPFMTKRFVGAKLVVVGSGSTQVGSVTFALNDVSNASDITNLFNRFRIAGIQYRWVVTLDPMIATTKTYPRVTWANDYDDSDPPSTVGISEYPRMKEYYAGDSRQTSKWYFFRPSYLTVAYESLTASAYRPTWKGMLDTQSPATPFYGIKWSAENLQVGVNLSLQCRYYIVARGSR